MIEIVNKNKYYITVNKPAGLPTQSDLSGDEDLMSMLRSDLLALGESSDLWLIHRLDRVVGGLVVFARNKKSAASLSEIVGGNGMLKE